MSKGCTRTGCIFSMAARSTMSVAPPGGSGTMKRTGLSGQMDLAESLYQHAAARTLRGLLTPQ